jgi:hypothetical protein
MHAATHAATPVAPVTATRRWVGRAISALAVLFLLVDGAIKALRLEAAVEATAQLGYPEHLTPGIGLLELACLVVYVMPRTSVLGAIMLTGYLGGAVATHVRAGSEPFSVLFPIVLGGLLWGGLYVRNARLRTLLPLC